MLEWYDSTIQLRCNGNQALLLVPTKSQESWTTSFVGLRSFSGCNIFIFTGETQRHKNSCFFLILCSNSFNFTRYNKSFSWTDYFVPIFKEETACFCIKRGQSHAKASRHWETCLFICLQYWIRGKNNHYSCQETFTSPPSLLTLQFYVTFLSIEVRKF